VRNASLPAQDATAASPGKKIPTTKTGVEPVQPANAVDENVRQIFYAANYVRDLDIRLEKAGDGTCETTLAVHDRLRQQHGFVHGGVVATLADHTAGGAARSVSGTRDVLTVEYKINFLRPASGDRLRCTATVIKAGKSVIVAEALVFCNGAGGEQLVAKLTETLFVVDSQV
jgi:uncharacterized protein (TIGR00369 family)